MANDDRLCLQTPKGLVTYIGFADNHKSTLSFVSPKLMVGTTCAAGADLTSDHAPVDIHINKKSKVFSMKKRPKDT